MLALVTVSTLTIEIAPGRGRAVAAVFPPWWSASRTAAAGGAAGQIVGASGAPFVIALQSNTPGLAARAHAQGAWLVIDRDLRDLCVHPGDQSQ